MRAVMLDRPEEFPPMVRGAVDARTVTACGRPHFVPGVIPRKK